MEQSTCSMCSNHCAQYGQSMCRMWSNQCAHCGAINGLSVEQQMCSSVWSNQCAHCGATNVFTVWGKRIAQCGATSVLSVEQPMYLLWSNQCAHCGATNVLNVEHSIGIQIYPAFTQQCGNQASQYQINSTSCFACSKQKSAVHFQRSYVGCCQGCNSAECHGDGTKTFTCYFQVALRLT